MAPGEGASDAPGPQLEGPGAPVYTVPAPERPRHTRHSSRGGSCPGIDRLQVGHGPAYSGDTRAPHTADRFIACPLGCTYPSEEAPPRCSVILGRVKRRKETRVPRARHAPDGHTSGGTQPTDISVINRRVFLAPALPMPRGQTHHDDLPKVLPTLDIGSHRNARHEPLLEAGAQRTL
jgi:hypothetical protein